MPPRRLLLLRHGRSTANSGGILAGRAPGVELDETGRRQAAALVQRCAGLPIDRLICSPVLRCRQTVTPLADALELPVAIDERLAEIDYGDWTGRALQDLVGEPAWRTVQLQPSAMVFPGGESLAAASVRAVAAAREHGAEPVTDGGSITVLCSHGDVIKAIVADALGMHLDQFQRIAIGPASLSAVRYTPMRPYVERLGDTGSLAGFAGARTAAATVGGETGADSAES